MGDSKAHPEDHSPDTVLTVEVDLRNKSLSDTETTTLSEFDAITEQVSLAPDTESTIEIDLPKKFN